MSTDGRGILISVMKSFAIHLEQSGVTRKRDKRRCSSVSQSGIRRLKSFLLLFVSSTSHAPLSNETRDSFIMKIRLLFKDEKYSHVDGMLSLLHKRFITFPF